MKFQLASDIHLHGVNRHHAIQRTDADYLLLAGDVVEWANGVDRVVGEGFFEALRPHYKKIFYIPGNHEFYGMDVDKCFETMRKFCDKHDITFMFNDCVTLDDKTLLWGGTMWTDMKNRDPLVCHHAKQCMSDFTYTFRKGRSWTPEQTVDEHEKALQHLKIICENNRDKNIVVMTHHAPTGKSIDGRYVNDILNYAYHTELSEFILNNENIKAWCHGHVHIEKDYEVGQCRVMCNPLGYRGYHEGKFNGEWVFEV